MTPSTESFENRIENLGISDLLLRVRTVVMQARVTQHGTIAGETQDCE